MRVLIVSGGGNKDGSTHFICDCVARGFKVAGVDAELVSITDLDISFCDGCDSCRSTHKCRMDDDMVGLLESVKNSDMLILATPVRFSGSSSMIKKFMERFQPYWYMNDLENTKYMAGIVCGGSEKPNFDNVMRELKALCITLDLDWIDALKVSNTDSVDRNTYKNRCEEWGEGLGYRLIRNDL